MSATLILTLCLAVIAAPVSEPLGLDAPPSSSFLVLTEPAPEASPLSLRLGSGYSPVQGPSEKLNLVTSYLNVTAGLTPTLILDGELTSRAILDDAQASIPDRAGVRLRYLPQALASPQLGFGFVVGGSFGSDLRLEKPGPGVGTTFAGFSAGGRVAFIRYTAQVTAGWGEYRPTSSGYATLLPLAAGAGVAGVLPFLDTVLSVEANTQADLLHPARPWTFLGVAGLAVPIKSIGPFR